MYNTTDEVVYNTTHEVVCCGALDLCSKYNFSDRCFHMDVSRLKILVGMRTLEKESFDFADCVHTHICDTHS